MQISYATLIWVHYRSYFFDNPVNPDFGLRTPGSGRWSGSSPCPTPPRNFVKIRSQLFQLSDGQTVRQTDPSKNITSFFGGSNTYTPGRVKKYRRGNLHRYGIYCPCLRCSSWRHVDVTSAGHVTRVISSRRPLVSLTRGNKCALGWSVICWRQSVITSNYFVTSSRYTKNHRKRILGSPVTENVTHARPFEILQGVSRCVGPKVAVSAAVAVAVVVCIGKVIV